MQIVAAGHTDVGRKRKHNEDFYFVDNELGLYVVCDGMGGHAAGEIASQKCAQVIHETISKNQAAVKKYVDDPSFTNRTQVLKLVERSIEQACAAIYDMARTDPNKKGMGTTVVMMLVMGENAVMAHVGDSRIYLVRQGQVHQLTEDHSLVAEQLKKGMITREEAEHAPYANVITRAVGFQEFVQVDTLHFEMMAGDIYLLCSDGLHGYLDPAELGQLAGAQTPANLPKVLADIANERGGKDNITAVVLNVGGAPVSSDINVARKMEVLRRIPLFKHLTYKELMKVLNIVTLRAFGSGEVIIQENTFGDEMFIILAGRVQILKDTRLITTLDRGVHFGEMALIDNAPRSATVRAEQACKTMVIRRGDFYPLLRREPQLAVKLLWSFCQVLNDRLRATNEELSGVKDKLEDLQEGNKLLFEVDENDFSNEPKGSEGN
ncbi:MAG: hypothetical protein GMKNLPBB_02112 [Myxococcota bacterium]|nr:hypothetical protein [Myxococcota bacterium]